MTRTVPVPLRLLAFVVMVVLLVVGVFAFGRISDDATLAMGLTALWFGAIFLVGAVLALRRRELLVPLALGFAVVGVAAAVWIGLPTLTDKEVDERVVTGTPASGVERSGGEAPGGGDRRRRNVQVATGMFESIAHPGKGTAAVVELARGGRKLTLTDFETDSGPDLRLYVSTGNPAGGDLGDFRDLGALKGNIGNQQYTLPSSLNLGRYSTVVVWCRAFSVAFTSAALERS
jgi:hypothetical protein